MCIRDRCPRETRPEEADRHGACGHEPDRDANHHGARRTSGNRLRVSLERRRRCLGNLDSSGNYGNRRRRPDGARWWKARRARQLLRRCGPTKRRANRDRGRHESRRATLPFCTSRGAFRYRGGAELRPGGYPCRRNRVVWHEALRGADRNGISRLRHEPHSRSGRGYRHHGMHQRCLSRRALQIRDSADWRFCRHHHVWTHLFVGVPRSELEPAFARVRRILQHRTLRGARTSKRTCPNFLLRLARSRRAPHACSPKTTCSSASGP